MQYTESKQKSAELLRSVVALMAQHDAAFTPICYTVWYEYAAGINARLNAALERLLHTEPRLGDASIERLYREHIAGVDDKTMERISRDFQQVMTQVADSVQRTGDQAGALGSNLDSLNAALQGGNAHALSEPVQQALQSSREMQAASQALREQVQHSRVEIERLRAELDQAREEVFIDSLTRVLNRKGLDHRLDQLLRQAPGETGTHGLVLLDIDHFKQVNDTHGHLAGDQVIAGLGELLRRVVTDPQHFVARYGGEEFAIVLPNAKPAAAAALAERVRTTAKTMKLRKRQSPDVTLSVTISAGAAGWQPGESANDWLARADAALYRSKAGGRDRVTLAA